MILWPQQKPSFGIEELLREKFTYEETFLSKTANVDKAIADTRNLSVADPQPIYTSTIEALLTGRLLQDAYLSGWQYVLISDGEPQGVVELSEKAEGELPQTFEVLRPREYAEALNDVILRAEEIEGQYELRMLRVPAIYLVAAWLKEDDRDLLLPVVPPSSASLKGRTFTEGALVKRLERFARERRDMPDRRK